VRRLSSWERELILRLEREVEELKRMLLPIDLHTRAKMKLVEAIKKHRHFRSKRQWVLYARVSMDTFYRLEEEVIEELARQGYRVIYKPVLSRKGRIYRYEIRLKSIR